MIMYEWSFIGSFRHIKCYEHFVDDDIVGQISNALMAISEPKQCSGRLLKNYVTAYHNQFNLDKFKKAVENGVKKSIIVYVCLEVYT